MSYMTLTIANIVLWIMIIVAILDGSLNPSPIVLALEFTAVGATIAGLFIRD